MNYFLFILKSCFEDFRRNKLRTFLTSLGILIGVSSVILMIAFGLGLKKYINDQFESLGANLMFVIPGSKNTFLRGGGMMGGIRFDDKDVSKIKRIKTINHVAPVFAQTGALIKARSKTEIAEILASSEEIIPIMNLEIEEGRFIEKRDIQKGSKVIMLHKSFAEKLFNSASEAIGENIVSEKQNFKVIGILKSKGGGGFGGGSLDAHVYIPFKASYSFNPDKKYYGIYFKTINKEVIPETKQEVINILVKRYDKDDFTVMEPTELMETISSIFIIINTILVAIAAISLIVGGIGIMNIMYVSVVERIKEIGIRRAVGATKSDILSQFLAEAVVLSLLGGFLGLLISFAVVFFIQRYFPAYIDFLSILVALGVSSVIGIVFGVLPAKKAADLTPVEAIRYE
jgi:putative ABC transport system permease protein